MCPGCPPDDHRLLQSPGRPRGVRQTPKRKRRWRRVKTPSSQDGDRRWRRERHALKGARLPSCLGWQISLSRARRHGRGLERGPSAGGCSSFVLGLRPSLLLLLLVCSTRRLIHVVIMGLLPRLTLVLLVCCPRRSIPIDEPWAAVGHWGALGLSGSATMRGSRPSRLMNLHRGVCGTNLL